MNAIETKNIPMDLCLSPPSSTSKEPPNLSVQINFNLPARNIIENEKDEEKNRMQDIGKLSVCIASFPSDARVFAACA